MQTARILFEEEKVRTLADYDPIPSDAHINRREFRFESRCNEALQRLFKIIGSHMVPTKPPKNRNALERAAEDIYSAVSAVMRGTPGLAGVKRPAAAASGSSGFREPGKAQTMKESRAALSSDVAARLSEGDLAIEKAWTDSSKDPSVVMQLMTDPGLRDDLARAITSSGNVYAPGEQAVAKRNLPPAVHMIREAIIAHVAVSLRACAGSDVSGEMHMSDEAALPLAEAAVVGNFKWSTFAAASRSMRNSAAAESGSVLEIGQTFELMEAAWTPVMELVYCVPDHAGLRELRQVLGSTAQTQSAKLAEEQRSKHCEGLVAWMERVTEHFGEATRDFRKGGVSKPTIKASTAAFARMYDNLASLAAMAPQMAEWLPVVKQTWQRQHRGGGRNKHTVATTASEAAVAADESLSEHSDSGESSDPGKAEESPSEHSDGGDSNAPSEVGSSLMGEQQDASVAADAWPSKPRFGEEVWPKVRSLFKATFSEHCGWYCMAKCTNGADCDLAHEVPGGFTEFCEQAEDLE